MNVKAREIKAQGNEWGWVCARASTWVKNVDSEGSP